MSHDIEFVDGKAQMVYVGEDPWHKLGTKICSDLTPAQVLEAAGLDWEVVKVPAYCKITSATGEDIDIDINRAALVRDADMKVLDVVPSGWIPVQNLEAFEFFNDFIAEGGMSMETAGSLDGGRIVWALARINDGFTLFGGDQVDSYLHFTNFHKFGYATDVRFTPIRVVCRNTLTLSLQTDVNRFVKISHRQQFNGDVVKETLGIARDKLAKYKDMAAFLGSRKYNVDDLIQFADQLFPCPTDGVLSKKASRVVNLVDSQPGANYVPGSWWNAYNAVSYRIDHELGSTDDSRLTSAWYGSNKGLKTKALERAVQFAAIA